MYKILYFDDFLEKYVPFRGVWPSISVFLESVAIRFGAKEVSMLEGLSFIKIPFFGYHSNAHTGFSLSDLRVPRSEARRPEK